MDKFLTVSGSSIRASTVHTISSGASLVRLSWSACMSLIIVFLRASWYAVYDDWMTEGGWESQISDFRMT